MKSKDEIIKRLEELYEQGVILTKKFENNRGKIRKLLEDKPLFEQLTKELPKIKAQIEILEWVLYN